MGHGNAALFFPGNTENVVGLGKRNREGFFQIQMGPGLQRGHRHGVVLGCPARTDAHQLRLFLVQHLAVVRVVPRRAAGSLGLGTTRVVRDRPPPSPQCPATRRRCVRCHDHNPRPGMSDDRRLASGGPRGGLGSMGGKEPGRGQSGPALQEFASCPVRHGTDLNALPALAAISLCKQAGTGENRVSSAARKLRENKIHQLLALKE